MTADEKQRAREQWGNDPAGAVYGREQEFGTREFFDEVERHRYQEYAPWMPEVMGFNDFAGKRLLEVGCGMGTDLLQFARGGAMVTGVDLTPRSIDISRHHLSLYEQTGEFAISDSLTKVLTSHIRTACCITRRTQPARCVRFIGSCDPEAARK
jgi:2-polyprenyl-3-methyl-5-hydroxy-6-metoxy-1,4-benzoquinol methylase